MCGTARRAAARKPVGRSGKCVLPHDGAPVVADIANRLGRRKLVDELQDATCDRRPVEWAFEARRCVAGEPRTNHMVARVAEVFGEESPCARNVRESVDTHDDRCMFRLIREI